MKFFLHKINHVRHFCGMRKFKSSVAEPNAHACIARTYTYVYTLDSQNTSGGMVAGCPGL